MNKPSGYQWYGGAVPDEINIAIAVRDKSENQHVP